MKKIVFCNVALQQLKAAVYESNDLSVPSTDREIRFPVNGYLEKTLTPDDEVKYVIIVKNGESEIVAENINYLNQELDFVRDHTGAVIETATIETEFEENSAIHKKLMLDMVAQIENNTHIISDITYGPKDSSIVMFTVLEFAEKFLGCDIDGIIYGKRDFEKNSNKLCDVSPLFYLSAVNNTIQCDNPDKARKMFETLVSM